MIYTRLFVICLSLCGSALSADLALFDLNKDVAEKKDLRTELPGIYTSLKGELIDHLANINTNYPGAERPGREQEEEPKSTGSTPVSAPRQRSQEQFFKNRDRNKDEVITLEEFIGNPTDRNVPSLTKRFKAFDSNGDGTLQMDELKKQSRSSPEKSEALREVGN